MTRSSLLVLVVGTFSFDAPAVVGGSPLHATAGVFDLAF